MREFKFGVLPFGAALLPLLTFNASYLIAASLEHVPWCLTYLDGCTSVSSTGRTWPETLIFKTGVLATAVTLMLTWHRVATFLSDNGEPVPAVNFLRVFALFAAVSLAVYAITLGSRDADLQALRRMGINGFAISNSLVQIAFVILYRPLVNSATRKLFHWLVAICVLLPLIGFAAEFAKATGMPRKPSNNLAAWNAFLAVSAYYLLVARVWWHHGISAGRPASPRE